MTITLVIVCICNFIAIWLYYSCSWRNCKKGIWCYGEVFYDYYFWKYWGNTGSHNTTIWLVCFCCCQVCPCQGPCICFAYSLFLFYVVIRGWLVRRHASGLHKSKKSPENARSRRRSRVKMPEVKVLYDACFLKVFK